MVQSEDSETVQNEISMRLVLTVYPPNCGTIGPAFGLSCDEHLLSSVWVHATEPAEMRQTTEAGRQDTPPDRRKPFRRRRQRYS